MASLLYPSLFILCALLASVWAQDRACPFDPAVCICFEDTERKYDYNLVSCNSTELPMFNSSSGVRYSVETLFLQSDNVYRLPNNYFKLFSFIDLLLLDRNDPVGTVRQDFKPNAFKGTSIRAIGFNRIHGLVPPPESVSSLRGLRSYFVTRNGVTRLSADRFAGFEFLEDLMISETPIESIQDHAFSGIRKLKQLALRNVGLKNVDFLGAGVRGRLETLDLEGNEIKKIKVDSFEKLKMLNLNDNPVGEYFDSGEHKLPHTLEDLSLRRAGLTKFPEHNTRLTSLNLVENRIRSLNKDDLPSKGELVRLYLNNNPISEIDNNFINIDSLRTLDLRGSLLRELDFRVFDRIGYGESAEVNLDNNYLLEAIYFKSGTTERRNVEFSLTYTGLKLIHPSIEALFFLNPGVRMDISSNTNLLCDGIEWIAPYFLYTKQVVAYSTYCADKGYISLEDYLEGIRTTPFPDRNVTTV